MNYNVDGHFTVEIDDVAYEMKSVEITGPEEFLEKEFVRDSVMDYSTYKNKDAEWVNLWFRGGLYSFKMPYHDVTITTVWEPAHEITNDAIEELTDYYNEFVQGNYTDENWERLYELYHEGVLPLIKGADDPETVKEDYKSQAGCRRESRKYKFAWQWYRNVQQSYNAWMPRGMTRQSRL